MRTDAAFLAVTLAYATIEVLSYCFVHCIREAAGLNHRYSNTDYAFRTSSHHYFTLTARSHVAGNGIHFITGTVNIHRHAGVWADSNPGCVG